jgi:hypothetical protein
MFAGQGQIPANAPAEELVGLAEKAEQQVKNLIDFVYANDTAILKIKEAKLFDELEGNVTFYGQGVETLAKAQDALEIADYDGAIGNATEALHIFREVFRSIHLILEDAGLQTGHLVDAQGLLEAYSRALERIEHLREILPEDATEFLALLDQAEALLDLDEARALLLEGKVTQVASNLAQANQLISQVYQYLKLQAGEFNAVRIRCYLQEMERARERVRERLRYAGNQGVDVAAILESFGYHNETEFMQDLENMTQTAQGKIGDIDTVIQDLEALGQLIRQMNQTLTQEINRHQERHGTGGSGSSSGPGGSTGGYGSGATGTGSGSSGSSSGAGTAGYGSGAGASGSGAGSGAGGYGSSSTSSGGSGAGSGSGTSGSGSGSDVSGYGAGSGKK